jgi:hypothetical protein
MLDIDRAGTLKTLVAGEGDDGAHTRRLSTEEQQRLSELLEALPTQASEYRFGKHYIDLSTEFRLTIGSGNTTRRYSVTNSLEEDVSRPEVRPIVQTLQFLHGLVRSKAAVAPPPMAGVGPSR